MKNPFLRIWRIALHLYLKIKYRDRLIQSCVSNFGSNVEVSISPMAKMQLGNIRSERNLLLASAGNGEMVIGNVFFNQNCVVICRGRIEINDDCLFGPNCMIYDHDHKFSSVNGVDAKNYSVGSISIEKNCWIGGGTIILKNTHIGEGTVIGAGCVVKGDIPAHSIVTADRTLRIQTIVDR